MNDDRSILRRGVAYPLGDSLTVEEQERAGVKGLHRQAQAGIMTVMTGEKRAPKKGEWYFSGAIIAAYRAGADLSDEYYIGRLVKVENESRQRISELAKKKGE